MRSTKFDSSVNELVAAVFMSRAEAIQARPTRPERVTRASASQTRPPRPEREPRPDDQENGHGGIFPSTAVQRGAVMGSSPAACTTAASHTPCSLFPLRRTIMNYRQLVPAIQAKVGGECCPWAMDGKVAKREAFTAPMLDHLPHPGDCQVAASALDWLQSLRSTASSILVGIEKRWEALSMNMHITRGKRV